MTRIKLVNSGDLRLARDGLLARERVRELELDALVDTGATDLVLPADVVSALGLPEIDQREIRLADGNVRRVSKVSELCVEILGRRMGSDAYVMPAGSTPLIGQIQLEDLDLIVDPRSRELRVNPESPNIARGDLL
ncbi:MAG TPA: clan AA aspartic protease [Polyangiaceae bacterium]|nr:clan AA aspartic protease [Polyangiaceae bacterium]